MGDPKLWDQAEAVRGRGEGEEGEEGHEVRVDVCVCSNLSNR